MLGAGERVRSVASVESLTRIWMCESGFTVTAEFTWPGPLWQRKERRQLNWQCGSPVSPDAAMEFSRTIAEAAEWLRAITVEDAERERHSHWRVTKFGYRCFVRCGCNWEGDPRDTQGEALADFQEHVEQEVSRAIVAAAGPDAAAAKE